MATLIEGISSAVRGTFCSALKNGSNIAGLFPSGLGSQTISEALNSAAGFVCNAPFDGGGSGGGGAGGDWDIKQPEVPFSGGQCEGQQYLVTVAWEQSVLPNFTWQDASQGAIVAGKIISVFYEVEARPRPQTDVANIKLRTSSGTPTVIAFELLEPPSLSGVTDVRNVRITQICKYGNQFNIDCSPEASGECGDPEPVIDPVPELDDTIDVDYEDDDGNPISLPDLPIKFFPPCINLDGIRVPFEVETPFGKVCGKIGLRPDIPRVLEPDIDFDLCPSQRTDLAPAISEDIKNYFEVGEEIGGGGTPFPIASYGAEPNIIADIEKPILGIFVRVEQDGTKGKATQIFNIDSNSNAPDLLIPRLGQARFYLAIESEDFIDTEWSQPIDIKQPISFIPCPWEFGALAVDVQAEIGYKIVYAPAFRKSCCDACKGQSVDDILDNIDRCRID